MEVANSYGVKSWLCWGALLGMIRRHRLLPWNNDAEIACWHYVGIENQFKKITDVLNNTGYKRAFYYSSTGSLNVHGDEGVVVNINVFWKEGNNAVRPHESPSISGNAPFVSQLLYWLGVFMATYPSSWKGVLHRPFTIRGHVKGLAVNVLRLIPLRVRRVFFPICFNASQKFGGTFQKTAIPSKFFDSCSIIEFYNGEVLAPDSPEELLEFIYGKQWEVPKDNWSFYKEENKSITKINFLDEMFDYRGMTIL